MSIEHLLNSSPPRQSWSEVSIKKKGGPLAFLESLSANANVAVAQKRNNAVTNFIVMPLWDGIYPLLRRNSQLLSNRPGAVICSLNVYLLVTRVMSLGKRLRDLITNTNDALSLLF